MITEKSPQSTSVSKNRKTTFNSLFDIDNATEARKLSEGNLQVPDQEVVKPVASASLSFLLDVHDKELGFSMATIPENFYDCYTSYIYKACEICHKTAAKKDLHLCMLCESVMCVHHCSTDQGGLGNLCKHSLQHHGGLCAFLDTLTGDYIIYENLRFFILSGLYVNSLGLSLKEDKNSSKDYRQFQLDHDKMNKIKQELLQLSISRQIINLNIIENAVFRPGVY